MGNNNVLQIGSNVRGIVSEKSSEALSERDDVARGSYERTQKECLVIQSSVPNILRTNMVQKYMYLSGT